MNVSRVGDIGVGVCTRHERPKSVTVTIIRGAVTKRTNGLPDAYAASLAQASCGHVGNPATFSITVRSESMGVHRVGDIGTLPGGTYTMTQGSPNRRAGD